MKPEKSTASRPLSSVADFSTQSVCCPWRICNNPESSSSRIGATEDGIVDSRALQFGRKLDVHALPCLGGLECDQVSVSTPSFSSSECH